MTAAPIAENQVPDSGAGTETARSAAMQVAALPSVTDPRTIQEIALHAALYRAAYESNVGGITRHFLLEAPPGDVAAPPMAVDRREFSIRVLAQLADLNVPIARAPPRRYAGAVDQFPGTRERATRLRIRIIRRIEDQAMVQAEVGDWTADVASSRQAVTATWDGRQWSIERDRVRLIW